MCLMFTICIINDCNSSEISSLSTYCSCKVLYLCGNDTHVDTHVENHCLSQLSCFRILNYIILMQSVSTQQEAIIS
jgi:hypothetical protein